MSLRIILGKAGSGKTHLCLQEICQALTAGQEGPGLILLVPEQATFQMEHALAANPELGGLMRVQVLSFQRMAWRVMLETGGAARIPIGELGKRMVLRRLLDRHQADLRVFGRCSAQQGFADCLAGAIGELKTYRVSPEVLSAAGEKFSGTEQLLRDKLTDLGLLYHELENYLSERYTDPDDYLNFLADRLHKAPTLQGTEIWVDGFSGFTPQELAVLKKLLVTAERVNLTLCLDAQCLTDGLTEDDVFYPTWETLNQITALADEQGVFIEPNICLDGELPPNRFRANPELAHLEQNYFQYPAPVFQGTPSSLTVLAGVNRRAEVEAAAREMIRLCRDKGYRWRELAVLQREMSSYHELIASVFADYGIPFFIDHKRPVLHHPLIELLRSAMDTVITEWAYEPVFRYLKTDLAPVTRGRVDLLENYVLAHGLKGYRWTDDPDWSYRRRYTLGEDQDMSAGETAELAVINRTRRRATAQLAKFYQAVRQAKTAREYTTALCVLLQDLKVARSLERWSMAAEKAGQLEKAREHVQIWGRVLELFDEIVEALGTEELSPQEYLAVLEAGLENLRLGLIPPGLDQVLVGSLDRSRNPAHVRAVFLLGASDGVLPARPEYEGVFNDREREALQAAGVCLAPGGRRRAFEEQFLIYTALTRASESLWVTYPLADEEGRAIAPSQVITRIKELFPDLKQHICQVEPVGSYSHLPMDEQNEPAAEENWQKGDREFIVNPKRALAYMASRFRLLKDGQQIDPVWFDVCSWFVEDARRKALAERVLQGLFAVNQEKRLSSVTSRKLYGETLRSGVSRIEKYRACPFAHFANYGLKLKERKIFKLAAPDLGEFFHAALKGFAERLQEENLDWGSLSQEECRNLSGQVIDSLIPQLQSEILLSTARLRYLTRKLKNIVDRAVLVLAEHSRRSSFHPVGLELAFGPEGQLPPVKIKLAGDTALELTGRIDRVDLAQTVQGAYLRVIDYKSSDYKISLPEIYHGLRLQLLTYLHVALTHCSQLTGVEGLPGGIFYFTVQDPVLSQQGPLDKETADRKVLEKLKMQGLSLADPDVFRMMDNQVASGYSQLFSVGLKADGSFYSNSQVLTMERFGQLRHFLETHLAEAGETILAGTVEIEPYRFKTDNACRFCPFKPVCRFDLQLAENRYRILANYPEEKLWPRITEGVESK